MRGVEGRRRENERKLIQRNPDLYRFGNVDGRVHIAEPFRTMAIIYNNTSI